MSQEYYQSRAVPRTSPRVQYRAAANGREPGAGEQAFRDRRAGAAGVLAANQLLNQDPDFDPNVELFKAVPPPSYNPSSGRPRGGGGGGGGGGVDQSTKDAYLALYNSMKGNTAVDDAWANYEASMRGVYDPSKINAVYDKGVSDVGAAANQGRSVAQEIYDAMVGRAATGRQAVSDAMAQGQTRLQDIQNRFGSMSGGATNQLNDVLGRFGAGGLSNDGYQNEINSQAQAAQLAQGRLGNVFDAALADRPALYAALQGDVTRGMTQAEQAYLNRLAAGRTSALGQNDATLQQVLGQAGISRAQNTVQQQQEALKLAAQLAEMGIKV